jgi:serine/threonine protein kinase/Flp pilus assembly protein TadD
MADKMPDIHAIFNEAIALESEAERSKYVDEACQGDPQLMGRVEGLIHAHSEAGSFLWGRSAAPDATIHHPVSEKPGTIIGPYKLLQQIGEGGMGVVYMAEQTEPVSRRVALKIIKPGMDTRQVIARFEAERQALAMMDHPNIAKVFDAGTTDTGRPYFVMELVKGVPITEYCDDHQLSPRERLELFLPACQAVQHAHQKGIIHRDIKPSNVMVADYDDRPVPKIIDFGVAKAVEQRLTEKTLFTEFGQVVGTMEYMSPEQAKLNQQDVDTRSDIYSLGVLLYELLVGETPFDGQRLRSAAFDEVLRIIREEEPPRPSMRLSTSESLPSIAANRQTEPRQLSTMVHGELDWIVMKALEKDRTRRYETASRFADDVQHYLNDEAVEACPPSAAYKFRKFARRNKTVMATTAAIVAALIVGTSVATWQAIRATQAEREARTAEKLATSESERANQEAENAKTEAAIAKAVRDFLTDDLLSLAGAEAQLTAVISPDPDVKLRTIVDRAADRIDDNFVDQPAIKAAICSVIGKIYHSLGEYQEAGKFYTRSVELGATVWKSEDERLLSAELSVARSKNNQGFSREAESIYRRLLPILRRQFGENDPITCRCMDLLATSLRGNGQDKKAEELHRETLEIQRQSLGPEHYDTLCSMNNLAASLNGQGKYREAEQLYREIVEIQRRSLGRDHPFTLVSTNNLANTLRRQGHAEKAEKLQRETLEIRQRVLGAEHPETLSSMSSLASSLVIQGHNKKAEQLSRKSLEISRRVLGADHPATLRRMTDLATSLNNQGQHEKADKLHRETLDVLQRALGVEHPDTLRSMDGLAVSLFNQGHHKKAEQLFRKSLEISRRVLGADHPITLMNMGHLAMSLDIQGQYEKAEKLYRETLDIQRRVLGADHPHTLLSKRNLQRICINLSWRLATASDPTKRNPEEAVRTATLASELSPGSANNWNNLGVAQYRAGHYDAALEALLKADGMLDGRDRQHRMFLAMTLWQLGRKQDALAKYVEGAAWIAANKKHSGKQVRFRSEAEELLTIDENQRNELIENYDSDAPYAPTSENE